MNATPFEPPTELVVGETEHWIINHRVGARLPGYLMIGSRAATTNLSEIAPEGLRELGVLMALAQQALRELFAPEQIYLGRYGHMAGHSIHFHVIPIHACVKRAFLADARYRVLDSFNTPGVERSDVDGAEMTLFVWRELCESKTPPPAEGPEIPEAVRQLRTWMTGRI